MKREWKVSNTYAGGEVFHQVYCRRTWAEPDRSGNRVIVKKTFGTEQEAQEYAEMLNAESGSGHAGHPDQSGRR